MQYMTYQGKQLCYYASGKGRTLVFLHGYCEDSTIWNDIAEELEIDYQVVRIDLPGFGRSEAWEEPWGMEAMAQAVHAVLEHLRVSSFILLGHSMGGYVSLSLAEQYPGMLEGLAMLHSHPYADKEEKKEQRYKEIEFIEEHGTAIYVKQLIPRLFAPNFARHNLFLVDKLIHRAARYPMRGLTNALHAMAKRPDRSGVLRDIACPVLFVNGGLDEAVPESYRLEQLALPARAQILDFPQVAHMGMFEAEQSFLRGIRAFIREMVQE